MRYILDDLGYIEEVSCNQIICDNNTCTEYTGNIPSGYSSLIEWAKQANIRAYKIVDGNLTYDKERDEELQRQFEKEAEENTNATHKWVKDKLKVSNSVVTDELASETTGTSLIVIDDAGNYEIPELKVESVTARSVNVVSSNRNILGIEAATTTINGVEIGINSDGIIILNGTSTDEIEFNLNGSSTNSDMLYLIEKNINYAISGLADNVSLSLYSFNGSDRILVGTYSNETFNISNSYKITQTTLHISSGVSLNNLIISPQIELNQMTSFIKHEETRASGVLNNNECYIDGLMSYDNKTIIMIDEEVTSSVKYYTKQFLNKKFAEIEVTESEVKSTVAEMNETIEGQNTAISQISQTVNEIKSEISDIADITISADGYGYVNLDNISESEPIYLKIHPSNNENISYLYPSDNLFPSDDLFPQGRVLRFQNGDYYIDYELPNDLLYYDEENYDEFILDYDAQTCEVNKKVGYNADGTTYLLSTPRTISYEYPKLPLEAGDYTVTMLGYSDAYMFVRMMCENIYTNQFATKVELNSSIIQTKESITSEVSAKYSTKDELTEAKSTIKQTTDSISLEVSNKVNNSDYTSATIMAKVNNDTSSVKIKASKIDLTGYVTISSASSTYETKSNASSTYATKNGLSSGTTTINGGCITTGIINAKYLDTSKINATTGTIGGWNIQSSAIDYDSSFYKVTITNGTNTNKDFLVVYNKSNNTYPFFVRADGYLQASNASITGTINSASGSIGGFTLGNYSLSGTTTNGSMVIQRGSNASVDLPANGGRLMLASTDTGNVALTTANKLVISDQYSHVDTGDNLSTIAIRALNGHIRLASNVAINLSTPTLFVDGYTGLTGQMSHVGNSASGQYEYYVAFKNGLLVGTSRTPFNTSAFPWLV